MNPTQLLPTVAEISVTLATLSGVAGVLGPRSTEASPELEARWVLLRDVAITGFGAALLALLPLLFEKSWRPLSGVAAFFWVAIFLFSTRQLALLHPSNLKYAWIGPLITLLGLTLFIANVVAPGRDSPKRYTAALLCMLTIAGILFIFAVFVGGGGSRKR